MMQQQMLQQTINSATLFLGDLSIQEIYKLFEPFGPIESIQLKRCEKKKPHLSYGFIKFAYRQSAEEALKQVNGSIFLGRAIRVGWALDNPAMKSPLMRQLETKNIKQTAQIHVTFSSRNPQCPVTETTLRVVFSQFGEVVDVTINKTLFSPDGRVQSGYGFVHYRLNDEGINAALTAISSINHTMRDNITFECSISHGLENYLNARRGSFYREERSLSNGSSTYQSYGSPSAPNTRTSLSSSGSSLSLSNDSPRFAHKTFHSSMSDEDLYRQRALSNESRLAALNVSYPAAPQLQMPPNMTAPRQDFVHPPIGSERGMGVPSGLPAFSIPSNLSSPYQTLNWNWNY